MRISRTLALGAILSLCLVACGGSDKPEAAGASATPDPSATASASASASAAPDASGSAAPTSIPTTEATATATPTTGTAPSSSKLTAAQAKSLAAAAILTASDYPGSKSQPSPSDSEDAKSEEEVRQCLGAPKVNYLTRNPGVILTKDQIAVISSADVTPTVAEAKAEFTASVSSKAKGCFEAALRKQAEAQGVQVKSIATTVVPITLTGADQTFGYDITVKGSYSGIPFTLRAHFIGARVGEVEISVSTVIPPGQSLGFETTAGMAAKATARVRAAYPKSA